MVLGGEHFFRFNHPLEVEQGATSHGQGSFEFARNELIKAQTARSGFLFYLSIRRLTDPVPPGTIDRSLKRGFGALFNLYN